MNTARWIVAAASLVLSACGAGVAAVVAGTSDSGGSSNTPPFVSGSIDVTDGDPAAPTAPDFLARISFLLFDPDPNPQPVDLAIEFRLPGSQDFVPAALVLDPSDPSVSTSLDDLATNNSGIEHRKAWDYGAQLGGTALRRDALLRIRVRNSASGPSIVIPFLGNEAPEVMNPTVPEGESSGLVIVPFELRDSSADRVSVRVEFEDPGAPGTWRLARPFGLVPSAATPGFAFRDLPTAPDVVLPLQFLWDSTFDLAGREAAERLRFTPVDRAQGIPLASAPFFVDNNALPVAQLDDAALITNDDQGRGIPIPFKLTDAESDPIDVVLQWRLENDSFPPLPSDPAELRALLDDPVRRRELQICTELPITGTGQVALRESLDTRFFVGTPEIGLEMGYLVGRGLDGQWIDILRPHADPRPVAASWPANPLVGPIAVIPRDEGRSALVLDGAGTGSWTLKEIELSTGRVLRELGRDEGEPSALAYEPGEGSVVVASHILDAWQLERVKLEQPGVELLSSAPAGDPSVRGELRGLVILGTAVALATVQDALIRINYPPVVFPGADPPVARLVPNLRTPWGLLRDPFVPNKVYLAERDFDNGAGRPPGRILHVNLDTHEKLVVVVPDPALSPLPDAVDLPRPQSLAYQREGARLIAVTDADPTDGTQELRAIRIGAGEEAYEIAEGLRIGLGQVHASRDGIVAVALPSDDDLATGGGLLQTRRIARYHPETLSIEVAEPFDPAPAPGMLWRIRTFLHAARSLPGGKTNIFLWDSSDAPFDASVILRVIPLDTDVGTASEQVLAKVVRGDFEEPEIVSLPLAGVQQTADLNSDGKLDLISFGAVYYQRELRKFPTTPDLVFTIGDGNALAADLNGDARTDLGTINRSPQTGLRIQLFLQDTANGPDSFVDLEIPFRHTARGSISAADLDADGRMDLLGFRGGNTTVHFGLEEGLFSTQPDLSFMGAGQFTNMDGDALLDMAAVVSDRLFELQGRGRQPPSVYSSFLSSCSICWGLTAIDINADGRIEHVLSTFGSAFLPELGDFVGIAGREPHYRNDNDLFILVRNRGGFLATTADFDANGLYDLLGSPYLYLQETPGIFSGTPRLVPFEQPVDLDGDGHLDSLGVGSFQDLSFIQSPERPLATTPNARLPASPALIADLNSDGLPDLVSSQSLFPQRAPGLFPSSPDRTLPDFSLVGDMNGDGQSDLVGRETYFQRQGSFSSKPDLVFPAFSSRELADLDSDGRLDVMEDSFDGDSIFTSVFFQRNDRSFGQLADFSFPTPRGVFVVDVDGNGRLDLLLLRQAGGGPALVEALYQVDNRQFAAPQTLMMLQGVFPQSFSDLDQDGRIDLIESDRATRVFFHTGDLQAPYESEPDLVWDAGQFSSVVFVDARDWTGDGRPDVLLRTFIGGIIELVLRVQTAPRRFRAVPLSIPNGIVTDLDLDGDPDLVAGDQVYYGRH